MAVPLLDLKAQHATIRDQVLDAIMPIVDGQTFILGEPVERFEQEVAALSGTRHAIGCANGTDAIVLALRALDIGRDDAVVTTPFTFFATAGTVHNVGATPVFADIDPETFNISVDAAVEVMSKTPAAKAVIAVDLFGQMAAIDELCAALPDNTPVIEDAAQSIGARRLVNGKWRMSGELSTIGTFSFFPSKNLGGYGDGGMAVTQDDGLAARLKRLRTHGSIKTYFHEEVGYNSRLDALQAAVLAAKLPHLQGWSAARRHNAALYNTAFADLDGVRSPVVDTKNESIYNQYTLRAQRRDELLAFLKHRGIGSAVYYPLPLHLQPCFAYLGYKEGDFPESERAAREAISIPVFPELTDSQRDEVISAVRAFYGH
ncbi:MAG: DegT/DnrJ/EryC1/StrS family aminotransferase [Gemmatimonadaceae bacterium]